MLFIKEQLTQLHKHPRRLTLAAAGLLILLFLATCRTETNNEQYHAIEAPPKAVTEALTQPPVWCDMTFNNGALDIITIGFYPDRPVDESLERNGEGRWKDVKSPRLDLRCTTTYESAFAKRQEKASDEQAGRRLKKRIRDLGEWMPEQPNEADYQIAILYTLYEENWQSRYDLDFAPPMRPQVWELTQDIDMTLHLQN